MIRIATLLLTGLLAACTSEPTGMWLAEDESGMACIDMRGDTVDITAPAGLTLWHPQPLRGNYRISYTAQVVMQGGPHDRLADLNCFWAASDPGHPDDFFARSTWRGGIFNRYNSLDLFYVGYGGNDNTTTRLRKYHGRRYGASNEEVKPLLGEYTDAAHLLSSERPIRIVITTSGNHTSFAVDGEELFSRKLSPGEGDGYFGLRLLANHTLIYGFKIEYL